MPTSLALYNSLTKHKEPFTSTEPGKVRIYNCGPTVYKRQHIGNMRRFLFADFLRRTLEFLGYEVREITNITDVGHLTQDDIDAGEDKLEREAKRTKTTPQDIAARETKHFFADVRALNIQPAHKYPRATEHIKDMQDLISRLLAKKHAYLAPTGVYFNVRSYPEYGKLSGNTLDEIEAGKRVEVRSEKKHPADFALWVLSTDALQAWDSPWGRGYPGWHIECSAMSLAYLGSEIDIHTGGEDNRFPHHENEIAQSEAATDKPFVRYWLHNRHLQLQGEKMAKRAGEQITLDTIRERGFSPLALRLLVFGSHYRSPLSFSWESLAAAQENLESLRQVVRRLRELTAFEAGGTADEQATNAFGRALEDDLNTPAALAVVSEYVRTVNARLARSEVSTETARDIWATLRKFDRVLGIFEQLGQDVTEETVPADVAALADQRDQARQHGEWHEADRLREAIEQAGYTVEDTASGPRVKKRPKSI